MVVLISLALRLYVACGGYSGANHPPKYGDFEAQRHWMEVTVNSPPSSWYKESEFNDLNWWRIDYPPLSAYFAWVWGQISNFYDPKIIEPYTSRGLETNNVKFIMRISVIISELIFLYPPLIYFAMKTVKQNQILSLSFILCSPLLILIDHGHFQYNCVMLGLILYSVILLEKGKVYLGSILYVMALNFKIMGLYYSLPVFVYILTLLYKRSTSFLQLALNIAKVGSVVIVTTLLIWIPYLNESFLNTLQAIFPVHRGLYQLHVGTFWCLSHVFIKWNILFENETLFKISSLLTLLTCLPILYKLFKQPKLFKVSLFTISQAFFLFSFHVHEKTILLPLIFVLINNKQFGLLAVDYGIIATITHHPLMIEDKLLTEYFILLIIYYICFGIKGEFHENIPILNYNFNKIYRSARNIPFVFYLFVSFCKIYVPPPHNYPYIYDLLIQGIGFYMYSLVFIISHFFKEQNLEKSSSKRRVD